MMHEKPFVHLFTIGKKTYAYDVNTNTVVPLEKDLYNCLLKTIRGNRSALSKEEETQLQYFNRQGLFLSHHVQKVNTQKQDMYPVILQTQWTAYCYK